MSMRPYPANDIPEDTQRVARAAFPHGNLYMRFRDELGSIYTVDDRFSDLFAVRGQPAESPARLALATVMQFAEGLSDRQTADAVRGRIDWKYALELDLTDPGFDLKRISASLDCRATRAAVVGHVVRHAEATTSLEISRATANGFDSCVGRGP